MWYPTDPTGECVVEGRWDGTPYEEVACLYPLLGKTYFKWELSGNTDSLHDWMRSNSWFPWATIAVYGLLIYSGQKYFANRPAWNLKGLLAMWNLALTIFSLWGFLRFLPHTLHNTYYYPWKYNLCGDGRHLVGLGSAELWCFFFQWSKFPELFDTFFVVVHKKKLLFLHWYHHMTVLICCWDTITSFAPTGLYFGLMNFGVHTIMYFYYFLTAIKAKPKWFKAHLITLVQILQMVAGAYMSLHAVYLKMTEGCLVNSKTLLIYCIVYGSYLVLFTQFFGRRFGGVGVKVHKKTTKVP